MGREKEIFQGCQAPCSLVISPLLDLSCYFFPDVLSIKLIWAHLCLHVKIFQLALQE